MAITNRRTVFLAFLASAVLPASGAFAQVTGTPAAFQMTVATTATKQGVYALWANPATWSSWDPQVAGATMNGPIRVGTRGKLRGTSGPDSNIEIIAMEPGVRFAYAASGPGLRMVFDRRFEAGDATRFTHSVTITGAASGFLAPRIGKRIQEGLPTAMQRLKAAAERGTGG
jgi:uncharacterized protein YndB with AHSA1/START domain